MGTSLQNSVVRSVTQKQIFLQDIDILEGEEGAVSCAAQLILFFHHQHGKLMEICNLKVIADHSVHMWLSQFAVKNIH